MGGRCWIKHLPKRKMLISLSALAPLVRPTASVCGALLGALCLSGMAHAAGAPKASLKKTQAPAQAAQQLQLPPLQVTSEPVLPAETAPGKPLAAVDCLMDRVPPSLEVSADAQANEVPFTPLPVAVTCLMAVSSDAPWIQAHLQRASGRLALDIEANSESAPRAAYAYVATKTGSFAIRVQQLGRLGSSDTSETAPAVLPAEPAVAAPPVNALPVLLPK